MSGIIAPDSFFDVFLEFDATMLSEGDYHAILTVDSSDTIEPVISIPVTMHVADPALLPDIDWTPLAIDETIPAGTVGHETLTVSNTGPGWLDFDVMVEPVLPGAPARTGVSPARRQARPEQSKDGPDLTAGTGFAPLRGLGGPDAFGYRWIDSDELGGPTFDWVEIVGTGTHVTLGDDDYEAGVPVGFDFPFYGGSFNTVDIGSNGMVGFGSPAGITTSRFVSVTKRFSMAGRSPRGIRRNR
jgi:hypothetical protein